MPNCLKTYSFFLLLIAILFGRFGYGQTGVVTNSLVLEYDSTNYSGSGTSLNDTSGNSRNGTLTGGPSYSNNIFTWTSGDYLTTPDLSSQIQNNIESHSIELWIKPTNNGVLTQYNSTSSPNNLYHHSSIEIVSGKLEFGLWDAGMISSGPTSSISFNQWHHIVMTYDGTKFKGYLNGQFISSSETSVNWDHPKEYDSTNGFFINFGYEDTTNQGDGTAFDGDFGVMRVYSKALSSQEVLQNYNVAKGLLEIVATGGDAENTTWRKVGNSIYTKANAKINASVIEGYLESSSLSITANVISINGDIELKNNKTLTLVVSDDSEIDGSLSGTGSIYIDLKNDASIKLSGTNTYSGNTTFINGAVNLGSHNAISENSNLTLSSTLNLHGYNAVIKNISGGGIITNEKIVPKKGLYLGYDFSNKNSYVGSGDILYNLGSGGNASLKNSPSFNSTSKSFNFNNNTSNHQYAEVSSFNPDLTNGFTIISDADFKSDQDSWERIVDFGNGASKNNILFSRDGSSGNLILQRYNGSGTVILEAKAINVIPSSSDFKTYAVSVSSSVDLFVDKVKYSSSATVGTEGNLVRSKAYIGKSNWADNQDLDIRSLLFYNRSLSQTEINAIHDELNYEIGTSTLTLNNSSDASFSGTIKDGNASINLRKTGDSKLILSNTLSYSGYTLISQGELLIKSNNPTNTSSEYKGPGKLSIISNSDSFSSSFNSSNWNINSSLSGLTIGTSSNTANITISNDIDVSGPISVYGGDITISNSISSTLEDADILLKATGDIITGSGDGIYSNGGKIILWSDSDNSNDGYISIGDQSNINSNGGDITLSGGSDLLTGFSVANGSHGVGIGADNANINKINSDGGDILIRGSALSNSGGSFHGVQLFSGSTIESGTGKISIYAKSADHYGLNIASGTSSGVTIKSNLTSGDAILLDGTSTGYYGTVLNYNINKKIIAGGGGNIRINGIRNGGGSDTGIFISETDILASTGNIIINGGEKGVRFWSKVSTIGQKTGTDITSSSSNITIIGDLYSSNIDYSVNSSGTLSILPYSDSFSSGLSFPMTNLSLSSNISGLTIGTTSNTANITISDDIEVAGPISVYGDDIYVSKNINTSSSLNGDILMKGRGWVILGDNTDLTTNGGDVVFWSNSVNTTSGVQNNEADFRGNNDITTNGGDIYLAGGLDNGNGRPAGYAYRGYNDEIRAADLGTNVTLDTDGGDIIIRGQGSGVGVGFTGSGIDIDSDGGLVTIDGVSSVNRGVWIGHNLDMDSNGGDINMSGISTSSYGIGFEDAGISIKSGTGSITIKGESASNTGINATEQFAINSDSNAETAIKITGTSSSSFGIYFGNGTTNKNILIQSTSTTSGTGDIILEGSSASGQIGLGLDFYGSGAKTQILSAAGDIFLIAKGHESRTLYTSTALFVGTKANSSSVNSITPISSVHTGDTHILSEGSIWANTGGGGVWTLTSGSSSNAGGDIIIAADTNDSDGGFIYLSSGLSANTYGGNITLGGGDSEGSGYAKGSQYSSGISGSGIRIDGALNLNTAGNSSDTGGDISIRGQGYSGSWGAYHMEGFFKNSGSTDINSGTGKINISAKAPTSQSNAIAVGFYINGGTNHLFTSANPNADAIKIVGDASDSDSTTSEGIILTSASGRHEFVATATGGGVILKAKGGENDNEALQFNDPVYVLANGGDIEISVDSGSEAGKFYGDSGGNLNLGYTAASNTTYDVINSNSNISLRTSGSFSYSGLLTANTGSTTIKGGQVIIASDTDNSGTGFIYFSSGMSISTNGGDITLGGGNTNGTSYAKGVSGSDGSGIRIDGNTSLLSDGGNITVKGQSYDGTQSSGSGSTGFGWWSGTKTFNSGAGKISLTGMSYSDSPGNFDAAMHWFGGDVKIISSSTATDAISIIADASNGSGDGLYLNVSSSLKVITDNGGGINLKGTADLNDSPDANQMDFEIYDPLYLISDSGKISMSGTDNSSNTDAKDLYLGSDADLFIGAHSNVSEVSSSTSDVNLKLNDISYSSGSEIKFNTSGSVIIEPIGESFESSFTNANIDFSTAPNMLTIGTASNTANITVSKAVEVAGPISVHGGVVTVNANITSSANGDIFLKGISGANGDVVINSGKTITKSNGTGTLSLQGHGRVINNGTITTTSSGTLNVIMWSDYDNDNNDGGVTSVGSISTNGGHVWLGGSSTTNGTKIWNGLNVGDGPSIGNTGFNHNALDLYGDITTNGGDAFIWAGDGLSSSNRGITTDSNAMGLNLGSGDAIIIADEIKGSSNSMTLSTTGQLTIAPNNNAYPGTFSWEHDKNATNLDLAGYINYFNIDDSDKLSGLAIGQYKGTGLSGDSSFDISNTSDITVTDWINIAGPISLYGGTIAINDNLTSNTSTGTITLQAGTAITQTASISTHILSLTGSGTTNLSNTGNSINKLSAGTATITTGTLSFTNSKALEIGVGADGILSSGTINIGTLSGNLTLSKTVSTSASDIKLYADKNEAAGNEGQGNIIINGAPSISVGSGGRASLYSGKPSSSTGLVDLLDGNSFIRTNVSSSTSSFSPDLSSGVYALFRTGPNVTFSENSIEIPHTSGVNSIPKSFVLSGTLLSSVVSLTAPTGFEISKNETSDYGSEITLNHISGSLTEITIYVRIPSSTSGYPSGTLSITTDGLNPQSIELKAKAHAALDFDGSNDYVALNTNIFGGSSVSNFTIEFWMRPDLTMLNDNVWHNIFGNAESDDTSKRNPSMWFKNGLLHYDSSDVGKATGVVILEEVWYHVAWTKNGTSSKMYLNGEEILSEAIASSLTLFGNYQIGGSNNFYKGDLENFRFWNTARSQTEIQENMYKSLFGTSHTGLISSYNFNDGVPFSNNSSNDTLYDSVGDNDGTLTNFSNLSSTSATSSTWVANPFPESDILSGYSSMPVALWKAIGTSETRSSNGLTMTAATTLSENNYANFASNSATGTTTTNVSSTENIRSNRIWHLNETGNVSATVKIGVASATGQTLSSFVSPTFTLIKRDGTSGNFSRVAQGTRSGDVVTFTNVELQDGYYSLGVVQNVLLTPTASQSKTLNGDEPTLSYTTSPSVSLSGTLSRTAGEDIGSYSITIGTISSSLYSITLAEEDFEIVVTDPNINGWNDFSLTYGDSVAVPSFTTSATSSAIYTSSYTAVAEIDATTGTVTATGVGTTTLWIEFPADGQFVSGTKSLTVTVLSKTLTVTADDKTKVFGDPDPELTYTSTPAVGAPVVTGSSTTVTFTGTLSRTGAEEAGTYSITLSTLSNTNYNINFVGGDFTITKAITVIGDGGSATLSNTTVTFGDSDLSLTPTSSNTADYSFNSSDSGVASITTTSTNTAKIVIKR